MPQEVLLKCCLTLNQDMQCHNSEHLFLSGGLVIQSRSVKHKWHTHSNEYIQILAASTAPLTS